MSNATASISTSLPFYFVSSERPPSMRNRKSTQRHRLANDLRRQCPKMSSGPLQGHLYGSVYLFARAYRPGGNEPDADNLSKFIWDLLGSVPFEGENQPAVLGLYGDDSQVRLRMAGIIDLSAAARGTAPYQQFDFSQVPTWVATRINNFVSSTSPLADYLTYIELGSLRDDLFRFGL